MKLENRAGVMHLRVIFTPRNWYTYIAKILANNCYAACVTAIASTVIAKDASAQDRFLSFPLRGKDPFSARINTVFDHSMPVVFCPNGRIVAYTGEVGKLVNGKDPSFTVAFKDCDGDGIKSKNDPQDALVGLKKNLAGTASFAVNGRYTGGQYLYYEGHPGYDYRTTDQKIDGSLCPDDSTCNSSGRAPIVAAADGIVDCVDVIGIDEKQCPEGPGGIRINHQNGYYTVYLHLSEMRVQKGDVVKGGTTVVGLSGGTGGYPPHLHFEVRKKIGANFIPVDPYGWQGAGTDPYTNAENISLWYVPNTGCNTYRPGYIAPLATDVITATRLDQTGFDAAWSAYTALGYSLVKFNIEIDVGRYYFKPHWRIPRPFAWYAWWGVDKAGFYSKCAELEALGFGLRLVSLERFVVSGAERYAATWAN